MREIGSALPNDLGDPLLNTFILGWDADRIRHGFQAFWDAPFYFPTKDTLTFSEHLVGVAVFTAPIQWITGNAVLALNVVALLSCVLCGLGAYVLARRLGISPAGAVVAGVIFAFSPPRFFRTGQLHLGVVQWIPFALASLHSYFDAGRRRDLRLAAGFSTLQVLSSGHGAVFLVIAVGGLLAWGTLRGTPIALARWVRDLGIPGALLLAPAALVYLPYRTVQQEMGLRRSLENWAVTPGSFLAAPTHVQTFLLSLLPGPRILDTASAYLFPGILPLLLVIAAAAAVLLPRAGSSSRAGTGSQPTPVAFYGGLAVLSVWLSIGPPLGLWPLVYWLPGMSFIRVPSRFTTLAVLGLAIVAAAGFDWLAARLPPRRQRVFASVVTLLLVADFSAMPLAVTPRRVDIPPADRWLASQPGPFAVAEVPLPDPSQAGPFERRQTMYMLHSMGHWQKTVHGYSGIRAPLHERLYALLRNFPDDASLDELARLGVRFVVVHTEFYAPGEWAQVGARIDENSSRLQLAYAAGTGRVYSLRLPATQ